MSFIKMVYCQHTWDIIMPIDTGRKIWVSLGLLVLTDLMIDQYIEWQMAHYIPILQIAGNIAQIMARLGLLAPTYQQTYLQEQAQMQAEQKLQEQVHATLQKRQLADNLLAQGQYNTSKEIEKAIAQQQKQQEQEMTAAVGQMTPEQLNNLILGQSTPPQVEQQQ